MKTEKSGVDESALGSNPSAEEAGETYEVDSTSGINVVLDCRLVETQYDKKAYQRHLKDYMKRHVCVNFVVPKTSIFHVIAIFIKVGVLR